MALNIPYVIQNLVIEILIPTEDIDSTDKINIFETDTNPSDGLLIKARIKSVSTLNDPSVGGSSYLFSHTKIIYRPGLYTFYYTITDKAGNESGIVNFFEHFACLVPTVPSAIDWNYLEFTGNSSGAVDLTTDLVFQYKMNDDSGQTTLIDSSDNANNGTAINNLTSVGGRINTAIDFDGATDRINIPNFTDFDTSDFSISFWMKTTETDGTMIDKFNDTSTIKEGFRIYLESSVLKIDIEAFFGFSLVTLTATETYNTGEWVFVTATFDRSGDMSVYKNGVLDNFIDISAGDGVSLNLAGVSMNFGVFFEISVYIDYFDGILDNICFYDKVITTAERTFLYNDGDGIEELANDLSEGFQTVFHFPAGELANPSNIVEDGDYVIGETNIGVDEPIEEVEYFRTYTDTACNLESGPGAGIVISDDSVIVNSNNLPFNDVTDVTIIPIADGKFALRWTYEIIVRSDYPVDPIEGFNIYYEILPPIQENPSENPSAVIIDFEDPSVEGFILDGTTSHSHLLRQFSFNSVTSFDTGTNVDFKILPYSISGEKASDESIDAFADSTAPSVSSDIITTTLI